VDQQIRRQIELELVAKGFEPSRAAIQQIYVELQRLIQANPTLQRDFTGLINTIGQLATSHVDAFRTMQRGTQSHKVAVEGLYKSYALLDSGAKRALQTLIGFASFSGFVAAAQKSVDLLQKYNKNLLEGAAASSRYGIGITQLERNLSRLGGQLALTRQETIKLFKQYEQGFGTFSAGGFEKLVSNIQKAVGPGSDAIEGMFGKLQGVLQKMPDLQTELERLDKSDKARINLASQRLLSIGQISAAEYKTIQTYINGSQQMSTADARRQREIEDQQRVFQEFSRHTENIGLILAKTLMPIIQEFANWLRQNQPQVQKFFEIFGNGVKWAVSHVDKLISMLKILSAIWVGGKLWAIGGQALTAGGAIASMFGRGAGVARDAAGASSSLPAGAGLAASAGGMGTFAKLGSGSLRFGLPALALTGASYGLDYLSEQQNEKGNYRTAGVLSVGGTLAEAGSYALGGAALGSIIPGIGTAVGAAVGGVIGLAVNAGDLYNGVMKLVGLGEEEKQRVVDGTAGKYDAGKQQALDFISTLNRETLADLDEKKRIETDKQIETGVNRIRQMPVSAEEFLSITNSLKIAEKSRGDADKRVFADLTTEANRVNFAGQDYFAVKQGRDGKKGIRELKNAREQIFGQISQIDYESQNGDISEARRVEIKGQRDKLSQQADEATKLIKKLEEQNLTVLKGADYVRDANENYRLQESLIQAINENMIKELQTVEALGQRAQSMQGLFDTVLQFSQMVSTVPETELQGFLDTLVSQSQKYQNQLDNITEIRKRINEGEALSAEQQTTAAEFAKKQGVETLDQINFETELNKVAQSRVQIEMDIVKARSAMSDSLKGELSILQSQTQLASQSVQLADSLAIGVGASAAMRQQIVQTLHAEIAMIRQMSQRNERQIALHKQMLADSNDPEQRKRSEQSILELEKKRLDFRSQILQKQQQEAEQTRALKDGWISALGAMNTGAGRFTKIMITQEQNLAAGLNSFKMITSSVSGAVRNAGGDLTQRAGRVQSTKFSAYGEGQLTPQGPETLAYTTGRGDDQARLAEQMLRGNLAAGELGNYAQQQAENIYKSGGLGGQAALAEAQGAGTAAASEARDRDVTIKSSTPPPLPTAAIDQSKVRGNQPPAVVPPEQITKPASQPVQGKIQGPFLEDVPKGPTSSNLGFDSQLDVLTMKKNQMISDLTQLKQTDSQTSWVENVRSFFVNDQRSKSHTDRSEHIKMLEAQIAGIETKIQDTVNKASVSSSAPAVTGGSKEQTTLNYRIPNLAVNVKFDNLNRLEDLIAAMIEKHFARNQQIASNFGYIDRTDKL